MNEFFNEIYNLFIHVYHLDFEWLFTNYSTTVYYILFAVIFIETGLVIWPFLPGDSLLFTAGLFARAGYLDISLLLTLLFIAAVLGDNCNYFIGRNIGGKVLKWKFRGKVIVKQKYLDDTHAFFEKYGPKAIILARFVPIVRTFTPFVAGVAEMKYRTFFLFDLLGGFIWIFSLTIAGYLLGTIDIIRNNIETVALIIVFLSVMPIIIEIVKKKFAKVS